MKKYNRSCEFKLRDAELLLSVALTLNRVPVAELGNLRAKIDEAWRMLLVNQFHDVLPGSSIELAHIEAKQWFRDCLQMTESVICKCLDFLAAPVSIHKSTALLNTLPWSRDALLYEGANPVRAVNLHSMGWVNADLAGLQPVVLGKSMAGLDLLFVP